MRTNSSHPHRCCVAVALVAWWAPQAAIAQLAPTGDHYAGRASDTGYQGAVNAMGGYSASVPLDLPPARGGLPLPLSVVYGARGVGAAGLGWEVPLSYVRVDTTFVRRRPAYSAATTAVDPTPRQQVTLSLGGQTSNLVPHGASWVARQGTLEVTASYSGGVWSLYDGSA